MKITSVVASSGQLAGVIERSPFSVTIPTGGYVELWVDAEGIVIDRQTFKREVVAREIFTTRRAG